MWGVRRAEGIVAYANHGFPVWDVCFSPFNAQFATGCYDGGVRVFSTERRSGLGLGLGLGIGLGLGLGLMLGLGLGLGLKSQD